MLNISNKSVKEAFKADRYKSYENVMQKNSGKGPVRLFVVLMLILLLIIFLPWTQNVRSKGYITTLKPDQRPQAIHSVIAGRIEKWYVQEGDKVNKGDTIVFLSEIKDDYFDPNLVENTNAQLKAKESSVKSYMEKVRALDARIDAMTSANQLQLKQAANKIIQAQLKISSDSIDLVRNQTNIQIADNQYSRIKSLYNQGLKSLTDLQKKEQELQKAQTELIAGKNKLLTSENNLINSRVKLEQTKANFRDDVAKAESDKMAAMSAMYDAEVAVTKLQNQFVNYSVRRNYWYILAPQDVYITQLKQKGIGQTVKQGEEIVTIIPSEIDLAVELFVKPVDLPLINKGQEVMIQFDGWPAIIFSGWPNVSTGTYRGTVYGMDNFISENGKYRILVKPEEGVSKWPKELRVGSATKNLLLLQDVALWYELWRKINGFPPDYYKRDKKVGKK